VPGPDAVRGLRIGWLGDLGKATWRWKRACCRCASRRCAHGRRGAVVEPVALGLDLHAVWDAWLVWRCALVAPNVAGALQMPGAREQIKPEALWEYDRAQGVQVTDFMRAAQVRSALVCPHADLLGTYDAAGLPVAQVWPFDATLHWPQQVAGRPWTPTTAGWSPPCTPPLPACPPSACPPVFTPRPLPAGLQLIGRPQGDAALLHLAAGYEALIGEMMGRLPE
jgi:amidase